jgi:dolichyl-phosphate beta-glucosyltransferase
MTKIAPHVSVIVPAYDEAARIVQTVKEVGDYLARCVGSHEIIVCADGGDGTAELVRDLALHDRTLTLIAEAKRRGKGHAVRRGVQAARGEIVGFVDADNKTAIDQFDRFAHELGAGFDLAIGSRRLAGSTVERSPAGSRRLGSAIFGVLLRVLFDLADIPDTQCGFKFFRRPAALDLFGRQTVDGYMFDVEILHLARQAGYRIAQVPVRWRDDGDSRFDPFIGSLRNVADLLRIRFVHRSAASLVVAPPTTRIERDVDGGEE